MKNAIADLHADLLCYLANDSRKSAYDAAVRCSIPYLQRGNVALQVLPVFTETEKGSSIKGVRQAFIFSQLPSRYPEAFSFYPRSAHSTQLLIAIENASSLFEEDEPFKDGLKRLDDLILSGAHPLYLSLTWNTENRFGGGAHTSIGLKEDGKRLIDYLFKHHIAIDFSHTSDALAFDILNYIDQKNYRIPLVASHSNMRARKNVLRNLPDELALEILHRKGLIGLNFYRPFIGDDAEELGQHLEHLISLGGINQVCFGADFHYGDDMSPAFRRPAHETFSPNYSDASCYGDLLLLWQKNYGLSHEVIKGIAFGNLNLFLENAKNKAFL